VKEYIKEQFDPDLWVVEEDSFTQSTPLGVRNFANIIATRISSNQTRQNLVLAAHYDSKYFPSPQHFVGAIDSAAPCAMILEIVNVLDHHARRSGNKIDLQVIFFDGEEAFQSWSSIDSIYGSRHLASQWLANGRLSAISAMILLDLLGAQNPTLSSYWAASDSYFGQLRVVEHILVQNRKLQALGSGKSYFRSGVSRSGIQDDHLPWLAAHVPIVHLIQSPFPSVWHRESDTVAALHWPTIMDLTKILTVFSAQAINATYV